MDKLLTIFLVITVLGVTAARTFNDYFDHKDNTYKPDHGFEQHNDGKWHGDEEWDYSGESHDFGHPKDFSHIPKHYANNYEKPSLDFGVHSKQLHHHSDCEHPEEFDHSSSGYDDHQHHEEFEHHQKHYGHLPNDFHHYPHQFSDHSQGFDYHHHYMHNEHGQKPFGSNKGSWDGNGWVFPEPDSTDDRYTMPWRPTVSSSTTETPVRPVRTTPATTPSATSTSPLTVLTCMRSCPLTSEYNPVCGSNNITYSNPGRLECAKNCGVDVTLQRPTSCAVPAPSTNQTTTTPTPNVNTNSPDGVRPTRFTTIDVNVQPTNNPVTIPGDILSSIFPETTTDNDSDIDIRGQESSVA